MAKTPNDDDVFDEPDEALYRSYSAWQLEQLRRAFATERQEKRSASGEARRLPAAYYDARLALIDRLLAERGGGVK